MVISLALLGYGASGSFLALLGARAEERFRTLYAANAALFALALVASVLAAQQLPFNALAIAWSPQQLVYLAGQYLLLAVPFFCVANCFGLAFVAYRQHIGRLYGADLVGAGLGALAGVGLLWLWSPIACLLALGVLALAAAALFCRRVLWLLPAAVLVMLLAPTSWLELNISPYKGLSQSLQTAGAEHLARRSSPLGLVDVLGNDRIPFRYAPGLSLAATQAPAGQRALFVDGEPSGVLTRFDGALGELTYLDFMTSALPYHLLERPAVLVLGAGGGSEVLQALYHRARQVTAVELNPQVIDLVENVMGDYTGRPYSRPGVRVVNRETRSFIAAAGADYDLIQLAPAGAHGTATAGLAAAGESYLYTREALSAYLQRLRPGGFVSVTFWQQQPPRAALKLFATAAQVLRQAGLDPAARLALIRGWKTVTVVIKNGVLSAAERAALQSFCRQRSFDVGYYPGIRAGQANRYNRLDQPYYYQAALALLGPEREEFFRRYKFDLRPVSDDRPFFFHFFKWSTLPELLTLQAGGGFGQLEWGYLVLLAALLQALLAALVLIVLPLLISRRTRHSLRGVRWRVLSYFGAIGLGFLAIEIAFIEKLLLFLGHPVYAIAVVLSAFLLSAGLGSGYSARLAQRPRRLELSIASLAGVEALLLVPVLLDLGLAWPLPVKVLCAVVLIAPLGFLLGMPFPLGLRRLGPAQLPWAWAINGCASVFSALLAALLAIEIGFSALLLAGAGVYLLAGRIAPG